MGTVYRTRNKVAGVTFSLMQWIILKGMGVPDAGWEAEKKEIRSACICLSGLEQLVVEEHRLTPNKSVLFGFKFRKFLIWHSIPGHIFSKFYLFI